MASPISTLSLFVLVLISGYFALPIGENELSGLRSLPFEHDLTTIENFNTRAIFGDAIKRSVDEHNGFESNTDIPRPEREMEDMLMTTDETSKKKREMEEMFMTTVETSEKKREMEDMLMTTVETSEKKREMEDMLMTTDETSKKKREMEDMLMTTVETSEKKREMEEMFMTTDKMEIESEHDKRALAELDSGRKFTREMPLELTTSHMPLFTSTSSAMAPELYTRGSIDFSSMHFTTEKYVGSLVDSDEDKHEKEKETKNKKYGKEEEHEHDHSADSEEKKDKRPSSTNKDSDDSGEDKKYVTGILFDQDKSKSFPRLPNNYAVLDESDAIVTTMKIDLPRTRETFTEKSKLTQGKESSQTE